MICQTVIFLTRKNFLNRFLRSSAFNIKATTISEISYSTRQPRNPYDENNQNCTNIRKKFKNYVKTLPKYLIEDTTLLVPEIIKKHGYPCEIHRLQTTDGYILETHRIPHGISGPSENRVAVLLQHGLLGSSADWIIAGPGRGFAYILADYGLDVWMPNARGSRYSRKHKTLDPDEDDEDFWNFSWHEIAIYDIAANIDYIIAATNQFKIYYIGYSQGTTVFYVLCAEKPEYNDKVRAMFSLAPIRYMEHITSPIMQYGAMLEDDAEWIMDLLGFYEFLPYSELLSSIAECLCEDDSIFQILCTNALFSMCGFNEAQMDTKLLPLIMAHTPAGASTKQILHYAQEINSGHFRQYDYGGRENKKVYGSRRPPKYKLKNVTAPVYFFYSNNDWMANPKDVKKLYKELSNPQGLHLISDKKFNHIDFLYAKNAPKVLYSEVFEKLYLHSYT